MHMARRVAAWVAWAVWTCNTPYRVFGRKRAGFGPLFFFVVRPAGRTHWEVKVLYIADMGKR
jgi:hypothetical protein